VRKLKKKTVKKKNSLYFGKEAHDAIIKYQSTDCRKEKNIIYENEIKNSFYKLSENLIYIHGFARDPSSFQILKNDCVTFLYETLEKFDPERGSKAFSYFNVCAKHYLIIQTNKKNKIRNRNVSLDNFKDLNSNDRSTIENYSYMPSPEKEMLFEEDKARIIEIISSIEKKIKNENEKLCLNAISVVFDKVDELEFLNKRAIFVYLREISGLNPKQLSVAMSGVRKKFKEVLKNNENLNGVFDIYLWEKMSKTSKEDKLKEFSDLLDSLENTEDKKKMLWKDAYQNAVDDRESAAILLNDLLVMIPGSSGNHSTHGGLATKYLERMSKCNDQILKLAELIAKEQEKDAAVSPDDIFNSIGE